MRRSLLAAGIACAWSAQLAGCVSLERAASSLSGPSTNSQLNSFAAEERGLTAAEALAITWALSGKETPAEAGIVESFRKSADSAIAAARAARNAGDNVAMASALAVGQEALDALTSFITKGGGPAGVTP